jgi:uncharacterized protein (TIGR03067 family)
MKATGQFKKSSPPESGGETRRAARARQGEASRDARRGGSSWIFVVMIFLLAQTAVAQTTDKAIQGKWLASEAELAGQKYPDNIVKSMTLVIKDNTYLVTVGQAPDRGTLTVAPSAKPKTMDISGTEGPNKGKTILAIYEQTGDMLRICYDLSGKTRPAAFKTEAGSQLFLVLYRREVRPGKR